jgi:hypothetical protein
MVDFHLLEHKSDPERSYWQNIFHVSDLSPKPDPAVVTLATVLSESAIQVFGLQIENLEDVSSFHYDDMFEGIVLTFKAVVGDDNNDEEEEKVENLFEAFVRIKNPETNIEFRRGELAVGTDFDPKELLFRNFFSAFGPLSKPVLRYDFVESVASNINVSAKIVWKDPVGRIARIDRIEVLNNSDIRDSVELKTGSTLFPGIWTVLFVIETEKNVAAKIPFLVTPLLPINDELSNEDYLKSLHRVTTSSQNVVYVEKDRNVDQNDLLVRQAELNAEKVGTELRNWISELAASFYSVESVCRHSENKFENNKFENMIDDPKLAMMPKCVDSEWSTFYPDAKSEIDF